jgi:hypothetical protein
MELHAQSPDDPDLLFMIAQEHAGEGRPAEALQWLALYVERGSDVGAGHRLAASCHLRRGDLAAARAALRAGIAAALACGHPTLAQELREEIEGLDEADGID